MVAFMNTLSSVLFATLLSVVLFATQGVNANALTDTLTGVINGPAHNSSKNLTEAAKVQQSIFQGPNSDSSKNACSQSDLDNLYMCTVEMCYCDSSNFTAITTCLDTLVDNKEINDASRTALKNQYGFTCIAKGQPIPGFNGASRLSSVTAIIGGVVMAAVLSTVV